MRFKALLQRTPLAGFVNTLYYAARGARLHPTARILGRTNGLHIGSNTKIGAGNIFNLVSESAAIHVGSDVWTYKEVELHTHGCIEIGDGTTLQRHVLVNGNVSIGSGCILGPRVYISSGRHIFDLKPDLPIREQERLYAETTRDSIGHYTIDRPVIIDDDCWLGGNVFIAPGVRVGRGAIVGANSVVTRPVSPYTVVAGAPARLIKERVAWNPPEAFDATRPDTRRYLYSGVKIEERGGELFAKARGEVSVALKPTNCEALYICFEASAPGSLNGAAFLAGRNELRVTIDHATATNFAETRIVILRFVFNAPSDSARLLHCELVGTEVRRG